MRKWIVTDFEDGEVKVEEMVIEGMALISNETPEELETLLKVIRLYLEEKKIRWPMIVWEKDIQF